jgi:hypothetical protein
MDTNKYRKLSCGASSDRYTCQSYLFDKDCFGFDQIYIIILKRNKNNNGAL